MRQGGWYRVDVQPHLSKMFLEDQWTHIVKYREWCNSRIGACGLHWEYNSSVADGIYVFYIKEQEDFMAFKLTFGL